MVRKIVGLFLLSVVFTSANGCAAWTRTTTTPPAGSALSRVKLGMNDQEVRRHMGSPSEMRNYQTGKAWIPYYWGPDTGRSDWIYKKKGRIVFSRNRYSGSFKVIRVSYEPEIQ